jgi:hypothetical protein
MVNTSPDSRLEVYAEAQQDHVEASQSVEDVVQLSRVCYTHRDVGATMH